MLSLKECRRILGSTCSLKDQELLELRDRLHDLAVLAVDSSLDKCNSTPTSITHEHEQGAVLQGCETAGSDADDAAL